MPSGVSPVVTRSAALSTPSTIAGRVAAKSRMNFSALSFPMSLYRLAGQLAAITPHVGDRLPGAVLAERALGDRRRRRAPVVDRDAGLFLEGLADVVEDVAFERAVYHDAPLFFAFGDELRVLGETQAGDEDEQ